MRVVGIGILIAAVLSVIAWAVLWFTPLATVENIEADHLDFFGTPEKYYAVFDAFAGRIVDGGTLVVTTHGGATRVALAKLLGLPEELWRAMSGLSNCHWSVVEAAQTDPNNDGMGIWRLLEHNVGTLPEPYELPEDLAEPVED